MSRVTDILIESSAMNNEFSMEDFFDQLTSCVNNSNELNLPSNLFCNEQHDDRLSTAENVTSDIKQIDVRHVISVCADSSSTVVSTDGSDQLVALVSVLDGPGLDYENESVVQHAIDCIAELGSMDEFYIPIHPIEINEVVGTYSNQCSISSIEDGLQQIERSEDEPQALPPFIDVVNGNSNFIIQDDACDDLIELAALFDDAGDVANQEDEQQHAIDCITELSSVLFF